MTVVWQKNLLFSLLNLSTSFQADVILITMLSVIGLLFLIVFVDESCKSRCCCLKEKLFD